MRVDSGIVILGAGLSGLSVARHLDKRFEIFEKEDTAGGLCRSYRVKGFTFDIAGHLLHFKEKKHFLQVWSLLDGRLCGHTRNSMIWSHGRLIHFPFQAHFLELPPKAAAECLHGFEKASQGRKKMQPSDFKSWIFSTFGPGIARYFMLPYNKKFWHFPLDRMDCRWAQEWVPVPALSSVGKNSVLSAAGYNAQFWYPQRGGIQVLIDALKRNIGPICFRHEAREIDLRERTVIFKNSLVRRFRRLISTVPLPELAALLRPLPASVARAFSRLKYISVLNVNLGVFGKIYPGVHWIYFPQKKISFYRMGIASHFCDASAPSGCSSLYFEISYRKTGLFDAEDIVDRILRDCAKIGMDIPRRDIRAVNINDIRYGYCLCDKEREGALATIFSFLKKHGILSIGRYGAWRYASMEDVMIEAEATAGFLNRE